MVTGQLGQLIQELAQELNLKLDTGPNDSCLINIPGNISIQMELDRSQKFFLIVANLGTVPVGKYREEIFKEALQYNVLPTNDIGSFGYSDAADCLILFRMLHTGGLSGSKIKEVLFKMIDLGRVWKTSIEQGEHPPQDYKAVLGDMTTEKILQQKSS